MRARRFFIMTAMMMSFVVSLSAQPFMGKPGGDRDREPMGPMMRPSPPHIYMMLKANQKVFNITDSQLEQIKNLEFALEEKIITLEGKISLYHLELRKLMMEEKARDNDKIGAALAKRSSHRDTIFIETLKTRDAVEKILTPEQQEAIKAARKKGFEKGEFPPGPREPRGPRGPHGPRGDMTDKREDRPFPPGDFAPNAPGDFPLDSPGNFPTDSAADFPSGSFDFQGK